MADLLDRAQKREVKKRKAANGRFTKVNTFTDATLHTLTPAQGIVWYYLWRNEKEGVVSESMRQIAVGTGLTLNGVRLAMKALRRAGLVEVVKLAKTHNERSVYRIESVQLSCTVPCNLPPSDRATELHIPINPIRRMRPKGRSAQQNQTEPSGESDRAERGSDGDAGPGNRLRLVNA